MSTQPAAKVSRARPMKKIVAPSACTLVHEDWIGVTIDRDPPPETSPNDRSHFHKKAKAQKLMRESAYLATTSAINAAALPPGATPFPPGIRLAVKATIGWAKHRCKEGRKDAPMDDNNVPLTLKGALDGFADALGVDDSAFDLHPIEQVRDQHGTGWVRIEAQPAQEAAPDDG